MTARSIIFTAPMIRALLAGEKTQTRRIVKPQPAPFVQHTPDRHPTTRTAPYIDAYCGERRTEWNPRGMGRDWHWWTADNRCGEKVASCPYGQPGDLLWVRETCNGNSSSTLRYRATDGEELRWRPSIHMPRWASRLTLRITDVRVQRLQEISEADARAEGVKRSQRAVSPSRAVSAYWDYLRGEPNYHTAGDSFASLWESINGPDSWAANPWVWALTFDVIRKNVDVVTG